MRSIFVLLIVVITGCSSFNFPGVHKISIQQGNVITQAMVDKLKPGMTKSQVRFVLGNAILDDSLNMKRWDYVYTIQFAGGQVSRKYMTLYFVDDQLSHFEGDYLPTSQQEKSTEG